MFTNNSPKTGDSGRNSDTLIIYNIALSINAVYNNFIVFYQQSVPLQINVFIN